MILDVLLDDWPIFGVSVRWWREAARLLALWGPVVGLPGLAAPVGLLGSVLALVILSGVALASLGSFLVAALALYLFLTKIVGLEVELAL